MKAFCNIVNLLAIIMVLLLGAVSVHAHEAGHSHDTAVSVAMDAADDRTQFSADPHPADGSTMHCGAPILGPEPLSLGCVVTVADVIYPTEGIPSVMELSSGNLRPPRR